MKHVFKQGGDWKTASGSEYTVKAVNDWDVDDHLDDGWYLSLEDALAIIVEAKPKTRKKAVTNDSTD